MKTITVQVPATSANCGPGFDCLGLALQLYNVFTFELNEEATSYSYTFKGFGADILAHEDTSRNLIGRAMYELFYAVGEKPKFGHIISDSNIPPSRGLGSSSTAIVGGLLLANALVERPLSKKELLTLAHRMEGHPDNVAPAIYGNLCCALGNDREVVNTVITVPEELSFAVVVPEVLVSTEYARTALPYTIDFKEAVANVGYVSLLISSMVTGDITNLQWALQDNLHVPYRKKLIPCCDEVFSVARDKGAYGATISGSGSTLIAYCHHEVALDVAEAMGNVFSSQDIKNTAYVLKSDVIGAKVISRTL